MAEPSHSLGRAVADIVVGTVQSTRKRDDRDLEMGLSEIMQQYQVAFSGTAESGWGFAYLTAKFEFPFYYAPGQRDPDFDRPHFWFGSEVSAPVAVSASVAAWETDPDNGAVVSAVVVLGACALQTTPYVGVLHLTFQGFSALGEIDPDVTT